MIEESADLLAKLPLSRATELLELNRGSYYRSCKRQRQQPGARDRRFGRKHPTCPQLFARLAVLCQTQSGYGYRRITRQLQREGWRINHKRVRRLMREAGWLCKARRRWVGTTQSEPGAAPHPNRLAKQGWRTLTGIDQAWVADLTYIPLRQRFIYLAVVMDAYSRRVVGWSLGQRIDTSLPLRALEEALKLRQPGEGWIHHSDRGCQYTSGEYQRRLSGAGAEVSMSERGAPLDNALAESLIGTIKSEEVDRQDYESWSEVQASMTQYIEWYNSGRLHSALGYCSPCEFEEGQQPDS